MAYVPTGAGGNPESINNGSPYDFCDAMGACYGNTFEQQMIGLSGITSVSGGGFDPGILTLHGDTGGFAVGDYDGEIYCPPGLGICTVWNYRQQEWQAANNGGNTNPPSVPKPPNPIENPSTKDKICFYATAAVSYFTIATGPGALPAASVPSIITGGATTAGEVGGFVIAPEIAVPVLTVGLTGAALLCL